MRRATADVGKVADRDEEVPVTRVAGGVLDTHLGQVHVDSLDVTDERNARPANVVRERGGGPRRLHLQGATMDPLSAFTDDVG